MFLVYQYLPLAYPCNRHSTLRVFEAHFLESIIRIQENVNPTCLLGTFLPYTFIWFSKIFSPTHLLNSTAPFIKHLRVDCLGKKVLVKFFYKKKNPYIWFLIRKWFCVHIWSKLTQTCDMQHEILSKCNFVLHSNSGEWQHIVTGVACLSKDSSRRSFFIQGD